MTITEPSVLSPGFVTSQCSTGTDWGWGALLFRWPQDNKAIGWAGRAGEDVPALLYLPCPCQPLPGPALLLKAPQVVYTPPQQGLWCGCSGLLRVTQKWTTWGLGCMTQPLPQAGQHSQP